MLYVIGIVQPRPAKVYSLVRYCYGNSFYAMIITNVDDQSITRPEQQNIEFEMCMSASFSSAPHRFGSRFPSDGVWLLDSRLENPTSTCLLQALPHVMGVRLQRRTLQRDCHWTDKPIAHKPIYEICSKIFA